MGEGATRVNTTEEGTQQEREASPKQRAEELDAEIEALRDELSPLVAEVDRRRTNSSTSDSKSDGMRGKLPSQGSWHWR